MFPWNQYGARSVQLNLGDALFLNTDGVPETTNVEAEDFTDDRLWKFSMKRQRLHQAK